MYYLIMKMGGEIKLYDENSEAATLIDQAVNNTRVLELID